MAKFRDVGDLAKSYIEREKQLAAKGEGLPVPHETWTDKEWNQLYDRLGRPEKPEAYGFTAPELPPGATYDEATDKAFMKWAHDAGLTKRQAEALRTNFIEHQKGLFSQMAAQQAEVAKARELGMERLKGEYGANWNAAVDAANRVVSEFGGDELRAHLNKLDLGYDPVVIGFLAKVGMALADDRVVRSGSTGGAAAAVAEIGRLKGDAEFTKALLNQAHPGHKEAKERWSKLHATAYPER